MAQKDIAAAVAVEIAGRHDAPAGGHRNVDDVGIADEAAVCLPEPLADHPGGMAQQDVDAAVTVEVASAHDAPVRRNGDVDVRRVADEAAVRLAEPFTNHSGIMTPQ